MLYILYEEAAVLYYLLLSSISQLKDLIYFYSVCCSEFLVSVIHVEDTATTLRFVLCNITVDGSTQYKLPRRFRLTQQKADKYGIVP